MRVDRVSSRPKKVLIVVVNPATPTTLGWPAGFWGAELMALLQDTPRLAGLDPGEYDAIMVAGGQAPMFSFPDNQHVHDALRCFYESEKPTCVYCHGTAALVDLKLSDGTYLVGGKTVAGFANVEEDFRDAFVGQQVMPFLVEDEPTTCRAGHSRRSPCATGGSSPDSSSTRPERSQKC